MNRTKIMAVMICSAAVAVTLFFLIFNEYALDVLQRLLGLEGISNSRVAKINALLSVIGVTGLAIKIYLVSPGRLNNIALLVKKTKFSDVLWFFAILLLIVIFSLGNINNPNFWLDESGQIWTSLGLNHFSPPFSKPEGLEKVYLNNNNYNMDPGGFTYLLHFWIKVGASPTFLRLLPFLFSLGAITLSLYLIKASFTKSTHSNLLPLVFLGSPLFMQYSFELRAYSFEMLVALSAMALAIQSKKILGSSVYSLLAGVWLAVGLTSRYSSIFPVAAAIAFVVFDAIRANQRMAWFNASLIVFPVFFSAAVIFIYVLSEQNPQGEPPDYVSALFLFNRGIFDIFLTRQAISVWAPVALLLAFSARLKDNQYLTKYVAFCLVLGALLLIASALKKYPLAFYTRFDISIHIVFWFGWAILLSLLISSASRFISEGIYVLLLGWLVAVMFILAIFARYQPNDSIYDNVASCFNRGGQYLILANEGSIPTVKYLFELGPLKRFDKTYNNITFFSEGLDRESGTVPVENVKIENYEYFLFSHYDESSEIYSEISTSSDVVLCDEQGPSEMYFRPSVN